VTTDSTATAPAEEIAPATADTATPADDTAKNTQASPPVDWQNRYKAAQAELTRTKQEYAALRRAAEEVEYEDEDEEAAEPAPPQRRGRNLAAELEAERAKREAAEWTVAESVYGEEIIGAYNVAADILNAAETAADYVAAFEAYHERRLAGLAPAQAAAPPPAAPSREAAVTPRVDSNRVDLLPVELATEEAKRTKDMSGYVRRLFGAAGIE
jgi:hypothetical protein